MRFPPASVIESWPPANYENPEKRGPELIIVACVTLFVAKVCLALRLYVRIFMLRRAWWDDLIMTLGAATRALQVIQVIGAGVTICAVVATLRYGWNIHIWDLPFTLSSKGRQISISGQTLFVIASGLIKWAILLSYLRIAPLGSLFRLLTWIAIAMVVALTFIFVIVLWTECKPATSYWDLFKMVSDCEPEGPPVMGQMFTSIFTDFIVYILPMPALFTLRLPLSQRLILMCLFGMGTFVIIAGCLRTYWLHYVLYETYDVTWWGQNMWLWPAVEINLGITCGCVPVLRPLLNPAARLLSSARSKLKSTTGGSSKSGAITTTASSKQKAQVHDLERMAGERPPTGITAMTEMTWTVEERATPLPSSPPPPKPSPVYFHRPTLRPRPEAMQSFLIESDRSSAADHSSAAERSSNWLDVEPTPASDGKVSPGLEVDWGSLAGNPGSVSRRSSTSDTEPRLGMARLVS